jgi:1-phosphofructokinase
MTKVATVTMNPAIDHTVFVNGFMAYKLNRAESVEYNIGGKGINVSKVLSMLGSSSVALGFLGRNAAFFEEELKAMNIETDFVEVQGRTRTNIKVVDKTNSGVTEINEPGPLINEENWEQLMSKVSSWGQSCEYVVIAGSMPPGVEEDSYKILVEEAKKAGAKVVLDAEGDALRRGLDAVPFMMKPNIHELEGLVGRTLADATELVHMCHEMLAKGVSVVVISMGGQGSIYASKEGIYRVYPLSLDVRNTVGAGDAMVAGYVHGMLNGLRGGDLARFGAGVSSCQIVGDFSKLEAFTKQVRVERWE